MFPIFHFCFDFQTEQTDPLQFDGKYSRDFYFCDFDNLFFDNLPSLKSFQSVCMTLYCPLTTLTLTGYASCRFISVNVAKKSHAMTDVKLKKLSNFAYVIAAKR